MKKVLALLMTVAVIMCFMPTVAFATGDSTTGPGTTGPGTTTEQPGQETGGSTTGSGTTGPGTTGPGTTGPGTTGPGTTGPGTTGPGTTGPGTTTPGGDQPGHGGSGGGGGSYTPVKSELEKAKEEATTAVSAIGAANKYDEAEQAEVNKIIEKAKADIKNAKTVEEVKAIKEAAQAEIEKILTSDEKAQIKAVTGVDKEIFKAKSKLSKLNGKKAIRVTWNVPTKAKLDGYEVYRSTKRYSGFGTEPYFVTKNTHYKNNKELKKGKTYYYKVRGFVEINGVKYYTGFSTKAFRTIK